MKQCIKTLSAIALVGLSLLLAYEFIGYVVLALIATFYAFGHRKPHANRTVIALAPETLESAEFETDSIYQMLSKEEQRQHAQDIYMLESHHVNALLQPEGR